ncbi:L-seryl-tRNA(Sec) selenium transferase [Desulforamulus ruminis]|uniref:L-seryl-tRNA(Sec) selenium transferase n=1 Tax=Desulforamulus ruminis (strain ATCC 23193 / DSM 2154 / NCIMB 8452 / DL) TaxID=696281 RepID=F6DRS6_DESRL|nr:L-seryl-tRNA(Sec) selenium transferase [Desulforamulus ruminis]AEG59837.1 L-seryl-tRNA selenium transferase [Desulforamulus ruminis DSM 2154]
MNMDLDQSFLRELPKVDQLLKHKEIDNLTATIPRRIVVEAVRTAIDEMRQMILMGSYAGDPEQILPWVIRRTVEIAQSSTRSNLRRVINATGVVLHTNLGRARLAQSAKKAVETVADACCNLEMNLNTGKRGSRYEPVENLLTRLTGAEAALVVNNNAAAVLLALGTMAKGKEVIVSRGQLVEIGGSFRIPEVMEQSGAVLVEVGATNKTHPRDYQSKISDNTALLLHVHTSNYRIVGFTKETTVAELVQMGREAGLPVMSDLGSGFLVDLARYGLPKEPSVQETVAAGADIVTFSGDKLLGGPQAGIIVGKRDYINQMKKNPLTRAVRIDKFTVAALEATLREYMDEEKVLHRIPTLSMLTQPVKDILNRAQELKQELTPLLDSLTTVEIIPGFSQVGGGSMPTAELPTYLLALTHRQLPAQELATRLRMGELAVVARVQEEKLQLDLRTVQANEIGLLAQMIIRAVREECGS